MGLGGRKYERCQAAHAAYVVLGPLLRRSSEICHDTGPFLEMSSAILHRTWDIPLKNDKRNSMLLD
jgi:hypothetical protein